MDSFIKLSNFGKIAPYALLFRQGLLVTVLLSLFTVVIGFVLALILALMRMSNVRPFRFLAVNRDGHLREGGPLVWLSKFNPLSFIATAYVEILRSTPVLVQIFIIYYGVFGMIDLPSFQMFGFIKFNRFFPGVVALGMNSGAYLCEIIRAGIQSVDIGQIEAARSLGLPYWRAMYRVVLPQAIRTMIPSIINQFIITLKDTSILSVIGFPELVNTAKNVQANTFKAFQTWGIVAIMYLIVITILSVVAKRLERRLNRGR